MMLNFNKIPKLCVRRDIKIVCCYTSKNIISNREMSAKAILYGDEASPPVRFVMMTASVLGIDLHLHKIDLFAGENRTEFYKTINPLMKVPALASNGMIIRDSHAIALHLCRQTDKQQLYPEELFTRAAVDDMLFFNASALFPLDSAILSQFFAGIPPTVERINEWKFLLDHLERCLNKSVWLVGDKMTLADLCCVTTVTSAATVAPVTGKYVKIIQWINMLQDLPCFEINLNGIKRLKYFTEKIKLNSMT